MQHNKLNFIGFLFSLIILLSLTSVSYSQDLKIITAGKIKNIVLVHGAFVDASIWRKVIIDLQRAGYNPVAVQLPMDSLKNDIKATQQVLDRENGPVILVGYSYGGMPVTQVGIDPKVKGLVYFAAMAPDVGQSINDLLDRNAPGLPGQKAVEISKDGYYWLKPSLFGMALADDAPKNIVDVMSVSQKPIAVKTFSEKVTKAAWKYKPSWYAVSSEDKIVPVSLERHMAKEIGARTIELKTSHAAPLSQPENVAAFISQAATSIQ